MALIYNLALSHLAKKQVNLSLLSVWRRFRFRYYAEFSQQGPRSVSCAMQFSLRQSIISAPCKFRVSIYRNKLYWWGYVVTALLLTIKGTIVEYLLSILINRSYFTDL